MLNGFKQEKKNKIKFWTNYSSIKNKKKNKYSNQISMFNASESIFEKLKLLILMKNKNKKQICIKENIFT